VPRQIGLTVENNFARGLITEATGLNFPENACTDTDNCIFHQIGEVTRRRGVDLESPSTPFTTSRAASVINSFLWTNVAGEGTRTFVVLQVGTVLNFYVVGVANSLSGGKHADTIDLTTFQAVGSPNVGTVEVQFTSGNGLLFVAHPYLEAFRVEYDPDTDSIDATQIDITIRDLEGVDDGLAVDNRPTSTLAGLTAAHNYNLRNQGWTTANLTAWDTAQTTMPSNADVPWYFKDANDAFDFSSAIIDNITLGNTPAPKGKFVLDLYDQDRTDVSGVSGVTGFSTGFQRASVVTFFAGRVFYAGLSVGEYNSRIFFTQIIERPEQYGRAYQVNDPSSEINFDLLPSDGGVIRILDAGRIIKMVPVYGQLIVFASNGIWAISGSEGLGFSAVDYTISKVSSSRCLSHTSFVDIDGIPMWWTADGIYTLQFDNAAGTPKVQSLTDPSIKNFYDNIPIDSKNRARGVFNPVSRIVQWLYRSTAGNNITENYDYDTVINLNTITGAFYPWSFSQEGVTRVNGLIVVEEFGGNLIEFDVMSDGDDVDSDGDDVIVISSETPSAIPLFKYIVSSPNGANYDIEFAEELDNDYVDFTSTETTPIDYDSYLISGYKIRGDAQRKWQSNQIYIYTRNDSDQAYVVQGRWNYASSGDTGRWSSSQIVEIPEGNYSYVYRKLKVRGHGLAMQYKISSRPGVPFNVIGWSTLDSVNERP
jgi:hypothetical protein